MSIGELEQTILLTLLSVITLCLVMCPSQKDHTGFIPFQIIITGRYTQIQRGTFSYFNPDETKNIAEISVNTFDLENEIEQLTIDFSEEGSPLFQD